MIYGVNSTKKWMACHIIWSEWQAYFQFYSNLLTATNTLKSYRLSCTFGPFIIVNFAVFIPPFLNFKFLIPYFLKYVILVQLYLTVIQLIKKMLAWQLDSDEILCTSRAYIVVEMLTYEDKTMLLLDFNTSPHNLWCVA